MRFYPLPMVLCFALAGVAGAQARSTFHVTRSSNLAFSNERCSLRLEGMLDGKKVELAADNSCDRILPPGDYQVVLRKDSLKDGLLQRLFELQLSKGSRLFFYLAGMSE